MMYYIRFWNTKIGVSCFICYVLPPSPTPHTNPPTPLSQKQHTDEQSILELPIKLLYSITVIPSTTGTPPRSLPLHLTSTASPVLRTSGKSRGQGRIVLLIAPSGFPQTGWCWEHLVNGVKQFIAWLIDCALNCFGAVSQLRAIWVWCIRLHDFRCIRSDPMIL